MNLPSSVQDECDAFTHPGEDARQEPHPQGARDQHARQPVRRGDCEKEDKPESVHPQQRKSSRFVSGNYRGSGGTHVNLEIQLRLQEAGGKGNVTSA